VSNYGTIGSKRELARDKREALISDLEPIWSIIIKNISDIPKLYSELDVFPRSFERKLLFIRNAKYWRKRGYVIPGVTKHENVSLLLLIISNFHNLISLIFFQGLRKIYRTKIN
jgi:hypothetical protein